MAEKKETKVGVSQSTFKMATGNTTLGQGNVKTFGKERSPSSVPSINNVRESLKLTARASVKGDIVKRYSIKDKHLHPKIEPTQELLVTTNIDDIKAPTPETEKPELEIRNPQKSSHKSNDTHSKPDEYTPPSDSFRYSQDTNVNYTDFSLSDNQNKPEPQNPAFVKEKTAQEFFQEKTVVNIAETNGRKYEIAQSLSTKSDETEVKYVDFSFSNNQKGIEPKRNALVIENTTGELFQHKTVLINDESVNKDVKNASETTGLEEFALRDKLIKDTAKKSKERKKDFRLGAAETGIRTAAGIVTQTLDGIDIYGDESPRETNVSIEVSQKAEQYAEFNYRTVKKVVESASKQAEKNAAKAAEASKEVYMQTQRVMYEANFKRASAEIGKKATAEVGKKAAKEATKKAVQEASKKAAEEAAKKAAQQAVQRAAVQKAAVAAAQTTGKTAAAVGGGAATGGIVTAVFLVLDAVKWFAKLKNSLKFLLVLILSSIMQYIIIFAIITVALYPFQFIVKTIMGIDGVETTVVEKATTAESIQFYLDIEKKVAEDDDSALKAALGAGGGGDSKAPVKPGMEEAYGAAASRDAANQAAYEEAAAYGDPSYFYTDPVTGAYSMASTGGGPPVFDDSSYRMETFTPGADGKVHLTEQQAAQYDLGGGGGGGGGTGGSGKPYIPPIFEGPRWKGTPPSKFADQWDSSEGVTDATSISPPEELYQQMLSTFTSNRQFLPDSEIKEYLEPKEVAAFFNSLPFWEWAVWDETYKCEGCIKIVWTETVTTYTYDKNGNVTGSTTEEVEMEELICPGHIYLVGDVQLDTDIINKKTSEHYNMDRFWDYLWGTVAEGETEEEAEKRRKDGVKAYKEILKQMKKDLGGTESSEESV